MGNYVDMIGQQQLAELQVYSESISFLLYLLLNR